MVKLTVVNKDDEKIGLEDKLKCHLGKGILHRAFSIFIFNNKNQLPSGANKASRAKVKKNEVLRLLIQKRSKSKLLWPLYWNNTCCGHPSIRKSCEKAGRRDKSLLSSSLCSDGQRRLKQEMGFSCPLKSVTKFHYQAFYKNIGSENEIDTILIGRYNGKVKPNPKEIADYKWVDIDELQKDIKKNPQKYTPWFKIALELLKNKKIIK